MVAASVSCRPSRLSGGSSRRGGNAVRASGCLLDRLGVRGVRAERGLISPQHGSFWGWKRERSVVCLGLAPGPAGRLCACGGKAWEWGARWLAGDTPVGGRRRCDTVGGKGMVTLTVLPRDGHGAVWGFSQKWGEWVGEPHLSAG